MSEHNLNEMVSNEVVPTTVAVNTAAPVPAPEVAPTADGAIATGTFVSLNDYLTTHREKITNAAITNLAGFSRVPAGKYMMFCSTDEENAELILFEKPSTLWMEQSVIPDAIKIESSGIVIKCPNSRYYIGKNNIAKIAVNANNNVESIKIYSRSKTADGIRVNDETVTPSVCDVNTVKLHVKKVSPRLYNAVKDMATKEEIKVAIVDFMSNICDLNHLIKIEKELLYTLGL
jgi:hypothetical protein